MLDSLFLFSAVIGGATVAFRVLLMLFGIGDDHSFGGAHDLGAGSVGDAGGHAGDAGAQTADSRSDTDAGTRLLSIQGVAAFLMMFGLVGLAMTREAGLAPPFAVSIALVAGLAAMWVLAKVFGAMMGLQSSGTLDLAHAIGQEGVVYLTIKPGSGGQVQISLQGRLGIYDAQTNQAGELATGRAIRVVAVRANSLVVEALPAA
ncbi:NfeD family protein [Myxococcota bacterium]|nr:NfeD family protein [Myxococcota bacterium]